MRLFACLLLLLSLCSLTGCGTAYGLYDDKRLMDTITDDKGIATSIKSDIMSSNFSKGWDTSVYCYYGHVYLVGDIPEHMRDRAVAFAKKTKGVCSVTTHWFRPAKGDTSNVVLATRLRTALIGAKGLSSTRVDTEVNAGRIVLLGVVGSTRERDIAVDTARRVEGAVSVTSYLMLPPTSSGGQLSPKTVKAIPPQKKKATPKATPDETPELDTGPSDQSRGVEEHPL